MKASPQVVQFARQIDQRLASASSFLTALANGWTDGDGRPLHGDPKEAMRRHVRELRETADWAERHADKIA